MSRSYFVNTAWALALGTVALSPSLASARSTGAPDGVAGDPPAFENCTMCHTSFPVNSGDGTLAIEGLPTSYEPGTVYPLTVRVEDANAGRWGFELTVIKEEDELRAGDLDPDDVTLVQKSVGAGDDRDYLTHTDLGTFAGQNGSAAWQIDWTAPEAGTGIAHFYLAGNAADNNGFNSNDRIYTIDAAIGEATSDAPELPFALDLGLDSFPNPAPGFGTVSFALPATESIELRILDITGRQVRHLASGTFGEGSHQVGWDGRDDGGRELPGGVYFARLGMRNQSWTHRMVLVQ